MRTKTTARLAVLVAVGALAMPARRHPEPLHAARGRDILQLSGAVAGDTAGGVATDERHLLFPARLRRPAAELHDFAGTTWPYIFLDGPLNDTGISADVSTAETGAGTMLPINGNPVYQFFNDLTAKDANGNFGPWFFIRPDGSATQSTSSVPAALPLLLTALAGLDSCDAGADSPPREGRQPLVGKPVSSTRWRNGDARYRPLRLFFVRDSPPTVTGRGGAR